MGIPSTIRPFYADWAGLNRRIVEGIRRLEPADLALPVPAQRDWPGDPWPIWAVLGHMAGVRVFWFCDVFGEPGAEATPFEAQTPGWEDDLSHPRSADELAAAFLSTWQVIEGLLARWAPADMDQTVQRDEAGRPPEIHSRQSILMRMITHEGYHLGEINIALALGGREPIDPWPGREWEAGAPRSLREG